MFRQVRSCRNIFRSKLLQISIFCNSFVRMKLVTQFILDYVNPLVNIVEIVLTSVCVGNLARVRVFAYACAVGESKRVGVRRRAPAWGVRGAQPPDSLYFKKAFNCLSSWNVVHLDGGTRCVSLHPNTI